MADDNSPHIDVRENAFLRVANVTSLTGTDGAAIETKPVMALCRCGMSQNKPFCDGSHKRNEFDGSSPEGGAKEKVLTYRGEEIDIHYSILLCSHAAECGRRLVSVFDQKKRPWIQPDNGSVEDIKAVVRACPSGALRYNLKGEEPQHLDGADATVKVDKNGPYRVSNVPLADASFSGAASTQKYVLCRCGLSKNKPFCDGSHRDESWTDEG